MDELKAKLDAYNQQEALKKKLDEYNTKEKTSFFEDVRIGAENVLNNVSRTFGDVMLSAPFPGEVFVPDSVKNDPKYNPVSNLTNKEKEQAQQKAQSLTQSLLQTEEAKKKDPGIAGSVVQGLTQVAGTTAAFMANPVLGLGMAATQTYGQARNTTESLKANGVDEDTANTIGLVMGGSEAISQLIPGYGGPVGKTIMSKVLPTVVAGGVNTAQGFVTNNYTYKVLSGKGHTKLAQGYNPYDPKNWITDFATGGVPAAIRTGYRIRKDAEIAANIKGKLDSVKADLDRVAQERKAISDAAKQFSKQKQGKLDLQGGVEQEQTPFLNVPEQHGPVPTDGPLPKSPIPAENQINLFDDVVTRLIDESNATNNFKKKEKYLALASQIVEKEHEDFLRQQELNKAKEVKQQEGTETTLPSTEGEFSRWIPVKSQAEAEQINSPDIKPSFLRNNLASGIAGVARLTNSSYLKYIAGVINDADAKAQKFVTERVHPLADKYNKMSEQEKVETMKVLQMGDQYQKQIDDAMMQKAGLSEKAQDFIRSYYDTNHSFLLEHNQNLIAKGEDPINPREGHVPSRWKGEYVAFGLDKKTGALKTVVIEPTAYQAKDAISLLSKKDPTVIFSKIAGPDAHTMRSDTLRYGISKLKALASVLPKGQYQILLDNASKVLEAGNVESAKNLYSFDQHEMHKLGVDGHLGKKEWKTDIANANDLFKSMVEYWEQGSISSNYMDVTSKIEKMVNAIQIDKPNTAEFLDQIREHSILQKTNVYGDSLNNVLKLPGMLTGMGANWINNSSARVGNIMQMHTLGMGNLRFAAVQLGSIFQQGLPNLVLVKNALKENPAMMSKHLVQGFLKNMAIVYDPKTMKTVLTPDEQAAMKYAQDRGMLQFSEFEYVRSFGESATKRQLVNAANATLSLTDKMTRPAIYLTTYNMLREAGYKPELARETAANVTQDAMVDYRQNARALMYNKLGTVGREASRLRTFIHGYSTNTAVLFKADKKAFMTQMTMLALMAGAVGIPGVELVDDLYKSYFKKSMFDNLPDNAIRDWIEFGAVSAGTGMWFQPSFSMSQVFPERDQKIMDYMFPYHSKASKMFLESYNFVSNPNTQTLGNAAIETAPLSARGAVTEKFKRAEDKIPGGDYRQDKNGKLSYWMSDKEWNWYRWGISSTELGKYQRRNWEYVKDKKKREQEVNEASRRIVDAYVLKEYSPKQLNDDLELYKKANGLESYNRLIGSILRNMNERKMTPEERLLKSNSYKSLRELLFMSRARVVAREKEKAR